MKSFVRQGMAIVGAAVASIATAGDAGAQQAEAGQQVAARDIRVRTDAYGRDVAEEVRETPPGKAGPIMLNGKAGPSIGFDGALVTAALSLDVGYAFVKGNHRNAGEGDLYGVFSPEVGLGDSTIIGLPVGVQYDIPLPLRNVYVYPRGTLGYAGVVEAGAGLPEGNYFQMTPTIGIKYVADPSYNLGFEPLSLPVYVGSGDAVAQYRMLAYLGTNF